VTVADAKWLKDRLKDAPEAKNQIAFADVILINKTDLVSAPELTELEARIRGLNPYARVHRTERARIALEEVLGRNAFDLDRILDIEPDFLATEEHDHDHAHHHVHSHGNHGADHRHHGGGLKHYHDEEMQSVSLSTDRPLDPDKFFPWIQDLDPRKELVGIERPIGAQRHRLHFLVVIVLETSAMMTMVGAMIAMAMNMMMSVVMVVLFGCEKVRLDIENTVKIEGVAAENLFERNSRTLGAVHARVRIKSANACFQLGQLGSGNEVGLVDQDHVGEGDLVLGFRRVLQAILEPFGVGDRHHRIELGPGTNLLVHEEGLRDRRRIGQTRRLDDDRIE